MTHDEILKAERFYVLKLFDAGRCKNIGSFLIWRLLVAREIPRRDVMGMLGITRQEVVKRAQAFSAKHVHTRRDARILEMRSACRALKKQSTTKALLAA